MAPLLRKDEPKYVDLDLNEVIKEVLTFTRGEQRRSQITVHSELLAGLQPVRGDRIQLQQVMLNLILNAIEAMRDVVDRPRLLQIQTSIGATGDAVVEVKTGLDAAVMHRIFDRFFTTKAGGTGLGLPICRSIIEAQGGAAMGYPERAAGRRISIYFTSLPNGLRLPGSPPMSPNGPSRHFAATQQFSRIRSEADILRAALQLRGGVVAKTHVTIRTMTPTIGSATARH